MRKAIAKAVLRVDMVRVLWERVFPCIVAEPRVLPTTPDSNV